MPSGEAQTPDLRALISWEPSSSIPREALRQLSRLVDTSTNLQSAEGLRRAIAIGPEIQRRLTLPVEEATFQYFLGNAWSELQRHRLSDRARAWEWDQPECEQAILAYRTAIQSEGFSELRPTERSSVLTNLGNLLDHLGRTIEAIHEWDHALRITPEFGMARGNRALGLTIYAEHLYDEGHKGIFLGIAHAELSRTLDGSVEPHARAGFDAARRHIAGILPAEYLARSSDLEGYSLGETPEEQEYRRHLIQARLFLNPLNDLGAHPIAARDILSTPPIVVKIGTGPSLQSAMNQLKQEFVAARYLYFRGVRDRRIPCFADGDVLLTDTLDYPVYGLSAESLRAAFRIAFSLLDKVAYLLNEYLGLGIPEQKVNFRSLWYLSGKPTPVLRPAFLSRENLPMRALYWLAKDLAPTDELAGSLEPDSMHLALIRNHLEHKFLKLHSEGFSGADPSKISRDYADTLSLHLNVRSFEAKCLRVLHLARSAIIYLALAIHRKEKDRATTRQPEDGVARIRLGTLPGTGQP